MTAPIQAAEWEPCYAGRAERMRASEIRELLKVLDRPGIISFAGGIPDPALFPAKEAQAAYVAVLGDAALVGPALQYSVSEGYLPLRQWIARHMGTLGVPCREDNIVITSGSQQALEFLGRLLLSPGDTALVTAPTYLGALQAFSGCEPRYDELRPEQGNRTPQSYARGAREAGGAVKFAYVVPSFANPTGETLSLAARERLLDLAAELDIPIIEDAAYADLRFEGEALPPILALEVKRRGGIDCARAIYCGTFSKILSPGLRVGWIVAPQAHDPPPRARQAGVRPQQLHHQPDGHAPPGRDGLCGPRHGCARPLSAATRRHAGGAAASHAPRGDLDAARRRPVRVGAPARGRGRGTPSRSRRRGGEHRLRAGRGVFLRRPRPQYPALELFAAHRGPDRGRHRPAGEADLRWRAAAGTAEDRQKAQIAALR